jgi:hypothetical protein
MKRRRFIKAAAIGSISLVGCGGGGSPYAATSEEEAGVQGAPSPTPPAAPAPPAPAPVQVAPAPPIGTDAWGPEYSYASPMWRQYRRDRATRVNSLSDLAERNTGYTLIRNLFPSYRPADGRVWYGHGNSRTWILQNTDGYKDSPQDSSGTTVFSFHPDNPTHVTRERAWPLDPDQMYGQVIDGWRGHDPVHDKWLSVPACGHGTEWDANWNPTSISPVQYVSSTKARFAATTTQVRVGEKLKFFINHPAAGANLGMRGRVTAVADVGNGQVEVTLKWFDPDITFQNPQSVLISANDPTNSFFEPLGAWQEGATEGQYVYFHEGKQKFCTALNSMDYDTGVMSRLFFTMPSRDTSVCGNSGQIMTPASTGRGHELWLFKGASADWIGKYDLQSLEYTAWGTSAGLEAAHGNFGCGDENGNLYLLGPLDNKLYVWNIRGSSPVRTVKTISASQIIDPAHINPGFSYVMKWNSQISMIELYASRTNQPLGVGDIKICLLDPSTDPVQVRQIGSRDQNGQQVWGAMFVHIPSNGTVPARTLLMGGTGYTQWGIPGGEPDKLRTFVAANAIR